MAGTNATIGPFLFSMQHPDRKKGLAKEFKRSGDTREETRQRREGMSWMCSNPTCKEAGNGDKALQVCSRCKGTRYCSKQCQVQHWPEHKPGCGPRSTALELVKNFIASNTLMEMLSVAVALELDLFNKDSQAEQNPICVQVGMLQADSMELIMAIQRGGDAVGLKSVLQVKTITEEPSFSAVMQENFKVAIADVRKTFNAQGHRKVYVIPIFFLTQDLVHVIFHALWIPPEAKRIIDEAKPIMGSSMLAGSFEIPFGKKGIIEMLNLTMRNGKENRLKVRAKLTQKDVELMRAAANTGASTSEGSNEDNDE